MLVSDFAAKRIGKQRLDAIAGADVHCAVRSERLSNNTPLFVLRLPMPQLSKSSCAYDSTGWPSSEFDRDDVDFGSRLLIHIERKLFERLPIVGRQQIGEVVNPMVLRLRLDDRDQEN